MSDSKQVEKPTFINPTSIFREYLEKGMILIPQKLGEYKPLTKWARFYDPTNPERPSEKDLQYFESFFRDNITYALVCGKPSGVIALDIDVDEPEKIQKLRDLFKPTCEKFGTKGVTFFFKYNGEESDDFGETEDGKAIVELKSTGSLVTIPPSRLPEKKGKDKYYVWNNTASLLEIELTTLPPQYKENLFSAFNIKEKEPEYIPEYSSAPRTYNKISESDIADALRFISADIPYKEWAAIGACIYSEFKEGGFYLFDDWSATIPNRYNRYECYEQYKKGVRYKRYSIGTIIKKAQDNGWINSNYTPVPIEETRVIDLKDWTKRKLEKKALAEIEKTEFESSLIQNAPPLIRGLTEWICRTAEHPQPIMSLGGVITALGFIMGQKYKTKSGKRSNIYSVCIADSQEGKEHVKEAVKKILREVKLHEHCERTWTSGAAIESALVAKEGQMLYCTEEMGILMRGMLGTLADKNMNEALAAITELATANSYTTKGYSDRKARPVKTIDYPNLALVGFSQQETFFESLNSKRAIEGLLNRFFIFQAPFLRPDPNLERDYKEFENMPEKLRNGVRELITKHDEFAKLNKFTYGTSLIFKEVELDEEATFYRNSLKMEVQKLFNNYKSKGEMMHLLIGRSVEAMERLSIIASSGETITMKEFKWAQSIVEYSIGLMCQASTELIADSEFERDCNKVLKYIQEQDLVTQTQLGQRFRKFTSDELNKIILKLSQMEMVKAHGEDTNGRKKVTYQSLKEPSISTDKFALTGKSIQGAF